MFEFLFFNCAFEHNSYNVFKISKAFKFSISSVFEISYTFASPNFTQFYTEISNTVSVGNKKKVKRLFHELSKG